MFHSYGHNPELFNLASRTCSAFFQYEPGFENYPAGYKLATIGKINLITASLPAIQETGLLSKKPELLVNYFQENEALKLPIFELYGSFAGLLQLMNFRILQWKKYSQHLESSKKNVLRIKFRSSLSREDDMLLEEFKVELKSIWAQQCK